MRTSHAMIKRLQEERADDTPSSRYLHRFKQPDHQKSNNSTLRYMPESNESPSVKDLAHQDRAELSKSRDSIQMKKILSSNGIDNKSYNTIDDIINDSTPQVYQKLSPNYSELKNIGHKANMTNYLMNKTTLSKFEKPILRYRNEDYKPKNRLTTNIKFEDLTVTKKVIE